MAGNRPTGIRILALLSAIGSVVGFIVLLGTLGEVANTGPLPQLLVLVYAVSAGVIAHGLWGLRWWAWPIALAMWIGTGTQAVVSLGTPTISTDLVASPLALVYLLRPDIRALFGARVTTPSRPFVAGTGLLAAVLALAPVAGQLSSQWAPTVPASAPSTLVASVAVPAAGPADATVGEAAPMGNACLRRDVRAAGWLDLCWSVIRQPDEDAAGDYYRLEVRGTFAADGQGDGTPDGSGVRWVVLRSVLEGAVADGVTQIEPDGEVRGCPASATGWISVGVGETRIDVPCDGVTTGSERGLGTEAGNPHEATVAWSCRGCLLVVPRASRAIGLADAVKVAEGATPGWLLYADFGD